MLWQFKHRWETSQIDSRTVPGTNKEEIAQWLADFGEDSDFFRVKVRGEFPRAGSAQFIASDIVAAARKYRAEGYFILPKYSLLTWLGLAMIRLSLVFARDGRLRS